MSQPIVDTEDVRYIPVPTEHVPAVLRYVADLMTGAAGSASDAGDETPMWSDADLIDFANRKTSTSRNYRTIMTALATREGDWVSIDELADLTGLDRTVVKAFRTQIYRYVHANTSYDRAPFPARWGNDLTPKRPNVVYYQASADHVAQWERVQDALN